MQQNLIGWRGAAVAICPFSHGLHANLLSLPSHVASRGIMSPFPGDELRRLPGSVGVLLH